MSHSNAGGTQPKVASDDVERLRILSDALAHLLSTDHPEAMVSDLFAKVSSHLSLDVYFNYMVNDTGDRLLLDSYAGIPLEAAQAIDHLAFGQAVCGTVADTKARIIKSNIQGTSESMLDVVRGFGVRAYACHPLMAGERLLGTLSFGTRNRDAFTEDEIEFLRMICQYVALAKDKAEMLESAKRQAHALREANARKDEFLAHMSHELRTPMNVVLGIATILTAKELPYEKQKELLGTLQLGAQSLMGLIDDLLDIARIESASLQLHSAPFTFGEIIGEIMQMFGLQAKEKNLALLYESSALDQQNFMGDAQRIKQIIVNLVGNAIKFTDHGGITIGLHAPDDAAAHARPLTISVRDTGIGIPEHQCDAVFEKFTQADPSITRKYGGSGLGLTISRNLAQLMGGDITVKSKAGEGSEFALSLPLKAAAHPESVEPRRAYAPQTGAAPVRVLLAEDNHGNQQVAKIILEEMGCVIDTAANGVEALTLFNQRHYELVLMDMQMPILDGFAATRAIRETEKAKGLPRVPIIAVTAHAIAGYREKCLAQDMDDYLSKPFQLGELQALVARTLDLPASRRA